jgi:hypothetical protein
MIGLSDDDLATLIRAAGESGEVPGEPATGPTRYRAHHRRLALAVAVGAVVVVAVTAVALAVNAGSNGGHHVTGGRRPRTVLTTTVSPTAGSSVGGLAPGCPAGFPTLSSTSATRLPGRSAGERTPRLLVTAGATVRISISTPTNPDTRFVHIEIVVASPGSQPSAPLNYRGDPLPHQGFKDPARGQQLTTRFTAPTPGEYPVLVATSYAMSQDCVTPPSPTLKPTGQGGEQIAELVVR